MGADFQYTRAGMDKEWKPTENLGFIPSPRFAHAENLAKKNHSKINFPPQIQLLFYIPILESWSINFNRRRNISKLSVQQHLNNSPQQNICKMVYDTSCPIYTNIFVGCNKTNDNDKKTFPYVSLICAEDSSGY